MMADCEWCDDSDKDISANPDAGKPLEGEPRPAGLFRRKPIVCDECWFGRDGVLEGKKEGRYVRN
jgi:hypothetical protein